MNPTMAYYLSSGLDRPGMPAVTPFVHISKWICTTVPSFILENLLLIYPTGPIKGR